MASDHRARTGHKASINAIPSSREESIRWTGRHDHNVYDKVMRWFSIIGKELHDPAIVPENVYNTDETGVLLSVLSSLKVLVSK
jgi:hypothetical protein